MRRRDQSFETGAGPRHRMGALHWLGAALAALHLAVLPGYAFDRTALAGESRAEPAVTLSSRVFSPLAPFLFEGVPPLVPAAIPAHAPRAGHRQPPFPGPALGSPLSRQGSAGSDREKGDRSRFSAPLYLSAAVTVSAAAVARFSKDRADNAYETYLKSAGRQRQQNHFEEAERYDRIAGAAFAVMEAGLVWSVYLLFF